VYGHITGGGKDLNDPPLSLRLKLKGQQRISSSLRFLKYPKRISNSTDFQNTQNGPFFGKIKGPPYNPLLGGYFIF
jgi:hypothetical protein